MADNKIFCSKCGKQIHSEVQYCPYCGQKNDFQSINWPDEPEEKDKKEKKEKKREQNASKSSNTVKILIGVCAVLAVIVVILLVSGFGSGKSEQPEEAGATEESVTETESEEVEVKDTNEPNDSADAAVALADGKSVTGYTDSKDDVDYFVISTEKKGTAEVTFSHASSTEQGGLGWKVNYPDNGTTRTELSWLSEEEKTLTFNLQKGDNYIFITGDSEASKDVEEFVRNTPYYITVHSITTEKSEEEEAEESTEKSQIIIINPYDGKEHYISGSGFVIPYSSQYLLTYSDIRGFSSAELRLARNEIYARHGRRFKDSALQAYFDAQSWYYGSIAPGDFKESYLSDVERENVAFIKSYE